MKAALALLFALLAATPALAATCKANPALTGPCEMMRGAVYESADGLMFQMDVRKQNLTLEADMPANFLEAWEQGSHARVHGMFEVCPLPATGPASGPMCHVCMESADELSIINPAGKSRKH